MITCPTVSKNIFSGSKYPNCILFHIEKGSTAPRRLEVFQIGSVCGHEMSLSSGAVSVIQKNVRVRVVG